MVWIVGVASYFLFSGLLGTAMGRLLAGHRPTLSLPAPWPELPESLPA